MPGLIYHCGATRYREPVVDTFCGLSLWRTLTNIKFWVLPEQEFAQTEGSANMPFTPLPPAQGIFYRENPATLAPPECSSSLWETIIFQPYPLL